MICIYAKTVNQKWSQIYYQSIILRPAKLVFMKFWRNNGFIAVQPVLIFLIRRCRFGYQLTGRVHWKHVQHFTKIWNALYKTNLSKIFIAASYSSRQQTIQSIVKRFKLHQTFEDFVAEAVNPHSRGSGTGGPGTGHNTSLSASSLTQSNRLVSDHLIMG